MPSGGEGKRLRPRPRPAAKRVQRARQASLAQLEGREGIWLQVARWIRRHILYRFWLVKPSGKPSSPAVDLPEDVDQIPLEMVKEDDEDDEDEEEEEDPWAGIEWEGDYTFILEDYERAWTM